MDKGLESAGRGNMRLLITPSSVLLPQALTAWHSARCSSIPGPSGQRAAMQGLVVPGSAAASTGQSRALFLCCWLQTTRILCMKRTVASSSNPKRLLLCSLSLRCSVLFCFFFSSLFLVSACLTLISISASLELTIAARRGHVHSAISSPCLVLVHSPGAPILPLSSLTRKCADVWTLFSPWYLTSGLPRALPSLPSKSLYFALPSSFQRSHRCSPCYLPGS